MWTGVERMEEFNIGNEQWTGTWKGFNLGQTSNPNISWKNSEVNVFWKNKRNDRADVDVFKEVTEIERKIIKT